MVKLVEKIVELPDGRWQVQSEDGKKNLGTYDTEDEAKRRLQQVHYFKNKGKKVNEDYLKTDEDKLSVMSMQGIISELGYDGIVNYRDGKIEADWATLSQLRRDAMNEFDIDLGEIIDESLTEGAEGKREPGFEYIIYDYTDENGPNPIVAKRSTKVEAEYTAMKWMGNDYITNKKAHPKYADRLLTFERVPKGKFKVGDDFYGPFDADYNKVESLTEGVVVKTKDGKVLNSGDVFRIPSVSGGNRAYIFDQIDISDPKYVIATRKGTNEGSKSYLASDLGLTITNESLNLTEAPDKFGIPTDDELEQEYQQKLQKAQVDRQAAQQKELETNRNSFEDFVLKELDPYISNIRPALQSNKLYIGDASKYPDGWYINNGIMGKRLHGSNSSNIKIEYNFNDDSLNIKYEEPQEAMDRIISKVMDRPDQYLTNGLQNSAEWISEISDRLVNKLSDYGVNTSGINGIASISSPSHWRYGGTYVIFSVGNNFYWFEAYTDTVFNSSKVYTGIENFCQIEDPRNLKYITSYDEYKIIRRFRDVNEFNNSLSESLTEALSPELQEMKNRWEEIIADGRLNVLEFPADYKYIDIDWNNGTIFAGSATNTGIMREFEMPLDTGENLDENIAELYDLIITQRPELLDPNFIDESKKLRENYDPQVLRDYIDRYADSAEDMAAIWEDVYNATFDEDLANDVIEGIEQIRDGADWNYWDSDVAFEMESLEEGIKHKYVFSLRGLRRPDDWGLEEEEFDVLREHDGEECTIRKAVDVDDNFESNYYILAFEDGYVTDEPVSGYHLTLVNESLEEFLKEYEFKPDKVSDSRFKNESLNEARMSSYHDPETGWHKSPERYKGYSIKVNPSTSTLDIYDQDNEVVESGFRTFRKAKEYIDNKLESYSLKDGSVTEAKNEDFNKEEFKQNKLKKHTENVAKILMCKDYNTETGKLNFGQNQETTGIRDDKRSWGIPYYFTTKLKDNGFKQVSSFRYEKNLIDNPTGTKFTVSVTLKTTSKDAYGETYGKVEIKNIKNKGATNESLNEKFYSYVNSNDDEELIKDSYNHFINDLGITPTVDDILEDIMNNYDQDMFSDNTPEEASQSYKDIRSILRKLGLDYLDESLTEAEVGTKYSNGTATLRVEEPDKNGKIQFSFLDKNGRPTEIRSSNNDEAFNRMLRDNGYKKVSDESLTEARTNPLKEILQRLHDDLEAHQGEDMFDFEIELPEKYKDKVSDIMRDAEGIRDYSIQEVSEFVDENGKPYVYVYMYIYPGINESLIEAKNIPDFYTWAKGQGYDPEEFGDEPDVEDYWKQQYDIQFNRNLKAKNYHIITKYTDGTIDNTDMGYFYEDAEDYVDGLSKDPNVESIRLILNKTGKLQNIYNRNTGWKKPLHSFILDDNDIDESLNEGKRRWEVGNRVRYEGRYYYVINYLRGAWELEDERTGERIRVFDESLTEDVGEVYTFDRKVEADDKLPDSGGYKVTLFDSIHNISFNLYWYKNINYMASSPDYINLNCNDSNLRGKLFDEISNFESDYNCWVELRKAITNCLPAGSKVKFKPIDIIQPKTLVRYSKNGYRYEYPNPHYKGSDMNESLTEGVKKSVEDKLLDLISVSKHFDNLDNIKIEYTPKGNLHVFEKGKDLLTLRKQNFNKSELKELEKLGYFKNKVKEEKEFKPSDTSVIDPKRAETEGGKLRAALMKSIVQDYEFADQAGSGEYNDVRTPKLLFSIPNLSARHREGTKDIENYMDAEKVISDKLTELGYSPSDYPQIKFKEIFPNKYGRPRQIKVTIPDKLRKNK